MTLPTDSKRTLGVGLLGSKFMGRAHSNAYAQVAKFFDPAILPVQRLICARDQDELREFARVWGWERTTADWKELCSDDAIDLVDVATPNHLHAEPAIAALAAGKHVACEKPLARTLDEARAMRDAAQAAAGKTFVWFNYRRCPAIGLARALVREGRLGQIYHVRAQYLQDWGGPETPRSWRFEKRLAGSGAHGDLNAHAIDLARFVTGEEFTEVHGAVAKTFHKERPDPANPDPLNGAKLPSDVDDALLFTASLTGGAACSFEASRVAGPHQNGLALELDGEKGSLRFEFENMNLLQFCDHSDGRREGGWRRIIATSAGDHPYVANWWPDAHLIGYEHGFTNTVADLLRVLEGEQPEVPLADFAEAYECQRVLEAASLAAEESRPVSLSECV
ncbi:MAG: Gfo/Idh/MocA family oxidoreductase [Planctomycetota bacterium]